MNQESLLTNRDVCDLFGISRVTAWRDRKAGILPYIKLGKEIRHTREQVEAFIAARSRTTSPQGNRKEQ